MLDSECLKNDNIPVFPQKFMHENLLQINGAPNRIDFGALFFDSTELYIGDSLYSKSHFIWKAYRTSI